MAELDALFIERAFLPPQQRAAARDERIAAIAREIAGVNKPSRPPPALQQCAGKTDEKERIACFDDLAKQIGNKKPSEQEETAKTSEMIQPSKPGEYHVVDSRDVYVGPRKYVEKPIELRSMHWLHADKDEYRCIAKTDPVVVFAAAVEPPNAREAIENNCGEIKKILSPQCTKTIRLTPKRSTTIESLDINNGC